VPDLRSGGIPPINRWSGAYRRTDDVDEYGPLDVSEDWTNEVITLADDSRSATKLQAPIRC